MTNIYVINRIDFHCDMVSKGKLTSCEAIQDRYIDKAIQIVNNYNLQYYIEELSDGWKCIWIYKDSYIFEIIKRLPNNPNSIYEHWILGKVFGYSDEAIKEFINNKYHIEKKENSNERDKV